MIQRRARKATGVFTLAGAALLVLLPAAWCDAVESTSGQIHQASAAGVAVKVDTRWVDGGGYRPVQILVTPTRPVVADRTLSFRFSLECQYSNSREDLRVVQDLELPANSGPVEATIRIPQMIGWRSYLIEVVEDGEVVKNLTIRGSRSYRQRFGVDVLGMLVVADAMPNTASLGRVVFSDDGSYKATPSSWTEPTTLSTAVSCSLAELPQRWLDYSNVDLLLIRLTQLEQLSRTNPAAFDAVIGWTAAGGNLLVSGVGQDWERIAELESLIGLPVSTKRTIKGPQPGWTAPSRGQFGQAVRGLEFQPPGPFDPLPGEEVAVESGDSEGVIGLLETAVGVTPSQGPPKRTPAPRQAHFAYRYHEMGMIVAIRPESPLPGTTAEWAWMLNSIGANRFLWSKRHGVTVLGVNGDYLNFLIPGVGLAPVGAFQVLITLFVVAIGPVNYYVLRRRKRLHWLVVTIPIGAGAITAALFAYALVTDGLGTRARVRSITQIDQRNQRAVCWSRISYYAGLAPSRGLTFSDDILVIPLERIGREQRHRRRVIWGQDQWLVSGWLNARTPTQYVTVRSRACRFGLEIDDSRASTEELRVKNGLGSEILQLLVRARDGKYFSSSNVPPGAEAEAISVDPTAAADQMRSALTKFPLSPPPGVNASAVNSYRSRANYQAMRFYFGGADDTSTTKSGLMESTLATAQRSLDDPNSTILTPGSYVAVVNKSPEVELGTDAVEESSLHVVVGKW